jgi:signal transduction histidine kinase
MSVPSDPTLVTSPATPLFERVLLLEDDPAHAHLIRRALKGFAGSVDHQPTLALALEAARAAKFDLVISDLNVPDAPPEGNVARLRETAPGVPVIVLTSSNSLRDAVEAMRLGANDFLVKDFDSNFREVLGFALSRLYAQRSLEAEKLKLEAEMRALRAAIENSSDGLAVADEDGRITYANSALVAFASLVGGSVAHVADLIGSKVSQRDRALRLIEEKRQSLAAGAVWSTEIVPEGGGNAAFDMSFSVVAGGASDIFGQAGVGHGSSEQGGLAQGGTRRLVVWVRDVQERKRREKFQREILSTTTHDLKGPLGAILLSADLIASTPLSPERVKDLVLRIASSAQSAVNLIDEFLSARRIQEGAFILKPVMTEVIASVETVVSAFSPVAQSRAIAIEKSWCASSIEWKLDRLGFERTLGNLLSNALKFTPKGGRITLGLAVEEGRLHLRVKDTGSGMEPSEVNGLFQRFARLAKHGDVTGTGLGLFVVKNVVVAHGGTVDVTSQPGAGTLFDISFPKDPPVNERGELIALDFA